MTPILEVERLSYSYEDGTAALADVSFTLRRGEAVSLLGPNGSGKTTLLLCLIGVLTPEGQVKVDGLELTPANHAAIRRKVGFLFQDPDDQLFLPTVVEDVAFGPRQRGMDQGAAAARAREALEHVGLSALSERPPYLLSAGEKQRAALAGLLAAEAEILVLDEPTTHLDPPARRHLLELLEPLPQAKILVTHDVAFAQALTRRAIFLEKGRVVADAPVGEVLSRFDWSLESRRSV